jgi:hypothetical protein
MHNHTAHRSIAIGATWVLACCGQAMSADTVYKCVKEGKVSYGSNPSAKNGQCQQTVIRDDGPKPEDLARLLEQKQLRLEADRKAQEASLKEREIRAKELEAAASDRRARAVEEELLLLRHSQQAPAPIVGYPFTYPYWGGVPRPLLPYPATGIQHQHPIFSYEIPRQTAQPVPKPHPVPPNAAVRVR